MFLILQDKNSRCVNYLNESNPPNIGEPKKNASATIKPRAMPTTINRLFIFTNILCLNKKQLNRLWK